VAQQPSTQALLEARELSVHFGAGPYPVRAVDGVSLEVRAGETLALVGESGSGKSTLAKALLGLLAPSEGEVRYLGKPLTLLGTPERQALCKDLQMIFQDPDASLNPRLTVAASIGEPLILHERLSGPDREERVCALMDDVGLDPSLRYRYPHELSGGQRQRVCIARALGVRPRLIVCDEAVSALDVSIQAQILNLLKDLGLRYGLTYLFITHDLAVVRVVADRIAVMYVGQVVELGSAEAVLSSPSHPYTQSLLSSVPSVSEAGRRHRIVLKGEVPSPSKPPSGCRFHPRCPSAMERCAREAPKLYGAEQLSRCFLREPEAGT
jgi:oligopeptide transport system ATP-binding protein